MYQYPPHHKRIQDAKDKGRGDRDYVKKLEEERPDYLRSLREKQDKRSWCNRLPITLGRTYWASGRVMHPAEGTIDFASVKIQQKNNDLWKHCAEDNMLLQSDDKRLANELPKAYKEEFPGLARTNFVPPSPPKMRQSFGEIVKGQWYFKTGRTTGLTSGVCHGTEPFCRMTDPEARKTRKNDKGRSSAYLECGYTKELIILRTKNYTTESVTQTDMSNPGDSGAFYVDINGRLAGVGFSGIDGGCGPMAYEMPDYVAPPGGDSQEKRNELKGHVYGASIAVVTNMRDIQQHLRQRINADLGFC